MDTDAHISQPPIARIFRLLHARWGPQGWWPADSALEMMVGAVLTQHTAWTNVERAISALKAAGLLDAKSLAAAEESELAQYLRPAGYFNVKARRLKALSVFLLEAYAGQPSRMQGRATADLRSELLAVHGVGPETADSILLYALGRPVFVVDDYTRRFLRRHGWLALRTDYESVAELFMRNHMADACFCNEYHALIVRLGKEYCRGRPLCADCPLQGLLPPGGPKP